MSGVKISRTENENRFKKGMYPTENDFANAFASFVHKDDTISMSQVTLGDTDETIGEVIDQKADKKNLEDFIKDVDTILETVRDPETGEISKTVIQDLSKRIEDAGKVLADTSNTAEQNESAIAKILSILGKQEGETVSELAEKFTSLSGDYATVYAFVSKVKDFLESADVADTTINRWQEIESFLKGITDTETLTGLLQEMKQEIIEQIPEPQSNYLEQVEDLDAYTDAPKGKIVQYIGQTNENYTRGFMYERVGSKITLPSSTKAIVFKDGTEIYQTSNTLNIGSDGDFPVYLMSFNHGSLYAIAYSESLDISNMPEIFKHVFTKNTATYKWEKDTDTLVVTQLCYNDEAADTVDLEGLLELGRTGKSQTNAISLTLFVDTYGNQYIYFRGEIVWRINDDYAVTPMNNIDYTTYSQEPIDIDSFSWQLIPVSPVIS